MATNPEHTGRPLTARACLLGALAIGWGWAALLIAVASLNGWHISVWVFFPYVWVVLHGLRIT
jgi:hypothetical protein